MTGSAPKITFDKAESRYRLVRDWSDTPPSIGETEHLYASLGLATFVLRDFCRQFADGRLVIAPDLIGAELDDLKRFLGTVHEVMASQIGGASCRINTPPEQLSAPSPQQEVAHG